MRYEATNMEATPMGKVVIKITHITWRGGSPRFIPGTNLRQLGFTGEDLKHPDSTWYSLADCQEWSENLCQQLDKMRKEKSPVTKAKKPVIQSTSNFITLGQLFAEWFASPRFKGGTTTSGRRTRKPLSKNSVDFYTKMARNLENDHQTLWNNPAAAIATHHLEALYDNLDEHLGVSISTGIMKTLSALFTFGVKYNHVKTNPVRGIEIAKPEPNLRAGTIAEMQHLIKCADEMGLPQLGDSVLLGLMTGQRQGDRLNLVESGRRNNRIFLKQQKTGAIVDIPETKDLTARLSANRLRNQGNKVNWPGIIIEEALQRPYEVWRYRNDFRKLIAFAITTMPSLVDFKDKHLRKTCVTWLANAGCTNAEIAQITGHTMSTVAEILKHYLAPDPERADNAVAKLENWLDKKGAEF